MIRAEKLVREPPPDCDPHELAEKHEKLLTELVSHFEGTTILLVPWKKMLEFGYIPKSPVVPINLSKRRGANIPCAAQGWSLYVEPSDAFATGLTRLTVEIRLMEWLLGDAETQDLREMWDQA